MMNSYVSRILLGAGFALLAGTVAAQTGGGITYPAPDKNAPQVTQLDKQQPEQSTGKPQAQPSGQPATQATPGGGDTPYPTADKPAVQSPAENAAQPLPQPTDKMSGQASTQAQASEQAGSKVSKPSGSKISTQKSAKPAHAAKAASRPDQIAARSERAYRDALRQCVMQQDQTRRDSCLDNAIEQFQRST